MGMTIYAYDTASGEIGYTVENVSASQIRYYEQQNIPFFATSDHVNIRGTYVEVDENGIPLGVRQKLNFEVAVTHDINHPLVADGVDKVVYSNIPEGTTVPFL